MNMKKIAVVLAGIACVAGSTSFAADTMTIKSSNRDSYAEVLVYKAKDGDYYQYYNSMYGYVVDIPKSATQADMNEGGDGCYFQDPKDDALFMTYAAKNALNFSIDELCNMDIGVNGSPELTMNVRTKNSYAIAWTDGAKSYYHELFLNEKNQTYTAFSVVYPTEKKDKYDKIISHMTRSFVPNGVKM